MGATRLRLPRSQILYAPMHACATWTTRDFWQKGKKSVTPTERMRQRYRRGFENTGEVLRESKRTLSRLGKTKENGSWHEKNTVVFSSYECTTTVTLLLIALVEYAREHKGDSLSFSYTRIVTESGSIQLPNGDEFQSPSLAAVRVVVLAGGAGARNGWRFWMIRPGQSVSASSRGFPVLDSCEALIRFSPALGRT